MSPASSIKRYADKWRAEQEPQSESLMRTEGVLVPKGRDIPLFSPERGGICGVSATIAMREMRAMRRGCKSGISAGILARSVVGVYFGHNDATELRARVPFLLI